MEVGAVKQAFNNEVILLKKKLNQAKIHAIHKLTRKAKTLTEKKSPEHLKEKLKKKAESAVNEVLIIKKIKARDIAKFIITHTGEVKDYLNRPKVDNDKACARLVLHKALQEKYKFIRSRFGNVPIKDLFMSRQERIKLKKEAREQQKNKIKGKGGKVVNSAGDWEVEDVKMNDGNMDVTLEGSDDDNGHSDTEMFENSHGENDSDIENDLGSSGEENQEMEHSNEGISDEAINDTENEDSPEDIDNNASEIEVGKYIKLKSGLETKQQVKKSKPSRNKNHAILNQTEDKTHVDIFKINKNIEKSIKEKRKVDKKVKENKNKNLKEKLVNRKFKKDEDDTEIVGNKVVDPFFITATGENYMSLAEPRKPDEVKEVHKHGNRQERRAAMFGHVAKFKPRKDNFRQNNFSSNEDRYSYDKRRFSNFRNKNDRFNNSSDFNDKNVKFDDKRSFNNKGNHLNDSNNKFNKFNDSKSYEKKEEKLHPSWEAKRKLKASMTLQPAHGKKIVFDDN